MSKIAEAQIPAISVKLFMYGSISHFLCDEASDFDIFVKIDSTCEHNEIGETLKPVVWDIVDSVAVTRSRRGTVVTCEIERNSLSDASEVMDQKIVIDFGTSPDGLEKAEFLRRLYIKYPEFLIVLTCLMEWGKVCGIIRAGTKSGDLENLCLLKTGEFHALILHVLAIRDTLEPLRESQKDKFHWAPNDFTQEIITFFIQNSRYASPNTITELRTFSHTRKFD